MGKTRRFKILDTAIRKYKAPVSTAGTPFYVYDRFTKGLNDFHPVQPERGESTEWKLKPFGVPSTESVLTVLKRASTRALSTELQSTGLALTDLSVSVVQASNTVFDDPTFQPAKIIVFDAEATTTNVTAAQNKVTGTAYKRRNGKSYTLPFGQGTTPGATVTAAMAYLARKVDAATGRKTVTFKPERFYGTGR